MTCTMPRTTLAASRASSILIRESVPAPTAGNQLLSATTGSRISGKVFSFGCHDPYSEWSDENLHGPRYEEFGIENLARSKCVERAAEIEPTERKYPSSASTAMAAASCVQLKSIPSPLRAAGCGGAGPCDGTLHVSGKSLRQDVADAATALGL